MKIHGILAALALVIFTSCGKKDGSSGTVENQRVPQVLEEASPGTYYAVLRPVNFHSNGFIPYGMANFTMKDKDLQVSISVDDDQAVPHRQALRMGTRCPTLADDTNGDGFVDFDEAERVVGPILMPLDSDLNSQLAGREIYPRGPGMTYNKSASVEKINSDLWKSDEDASDNIVKLAPGGGIGFGGRVVIVHGTSPQSSFPTGLASFGDEPAHLSLPIVCGVLSKIE